MYFEMQISREELDYLEKTADDLMRRRKVTKADRKIIVESFKEIKEKLREIEDLEEYIMAGSNEEKLPNPEALGLRGFSWSAGKWSLTFGEAEEEEFPSENFFEAVMKWGNIIDIECSWDMK